MKKMKKMLFVAAAAALALMGPASAQDFPSRPITMVIPFAAGGPQDTIGRIFAQRMSELLGQQVVVENVGGAGGMTGSKRVADAKPDGYTMVLGSVGTHAQNQTLYKHPLYNVVSDFTPVAYLALTPISVITRPDLPVNNFKEFIAYAKANQAKMQYGSAGAGSATHLACVVLDSAMGTKITHVPYKGTGPAMQDLIGGQIDLSCLEASSGLAYVEAGKFKAYAVMGDQRWPKSPDTPTMIESGISGAVVNFWHALWTTRGTPKDAVDRLDAAAMSALANPAVRQRLETLGQVIFPRDQQGPAAPAAYQKAEIDKWWPIIKAAGIKAE